MPNKKPVDPKFDLGFDGPYTTQYNRTSTLPFHSEFSFIPDVYPLNPSSDVLPIYNGGYDVIYKFNPQSFELTNTEASNFESNNSDNTVQYGVISASQAQPDVAKTIYNAEKSDYHWYPTYAQATAKGTISAVLLQNPISYTPNNNGWSNLPTLDLTSIGPAGAADSQGNPNTIAYSWYLYPNSDRKSYQEEHNYNQEYNYTTQQYEYDLNDTYNTSLVLNADGSTQTSDNPGGRFATLRFYQAAFINQVSPNSYSDSNLYRSSNVMTIYTPTASLLLPSTDPNTVYPLTLTYTLPAGVRYVPKSARVATPTDWGSSEPFKLWQDYQNDSNFDKDPGISNNGQTLTWTLNVTYAELTKYDQMGYSNTYNSDSPADLPGMTFKTTFDNYALAYNDGNPPETSVNLNYNATWQIGLPASPGVNNNLTDFGWDNSYPTVSLVGGPSASNSMDYTMGYPGAAFTIYTKPYTTVQNGTKDLAGIIPIPVSGDSFGSSFNGTLTLTNVIANGNGNTGNYKIDLYYSNSSAALTNTNPNAVDTKVGNAQGWMAYNGSDPSVLKNAKAIYYHVEGLLPSNERSISIATTYQTAFNKPGDMYVNQSYVNAPIYASGSTNNSNTSTYIAYTIVDNHFKGTLWDDHDGDGLDDNGEPGLSGIHVHLFRLNPNTGLYEMSKSYDPATASETDVGTVTDSSGNYTLIGSQAGQYVVGISKTDLDTRKLALTRFEAGTGATDMTINSHFNPRNTAAIVNGYYLSNEPNTLPEPAAITQSQYYFDNINAGVVDNLGGLSLDIPSLYFGKHDFPQTKATYSNQNPSGGAPNNTINVSDSRAFAYDSYYVTAKLGHFYNTTDNSEGIQASQLNYVDSNNVSVPINVGQEDELFDNDSITPGNVTKTYKNIRLIVPARHAPDNTINIGKYSATVDYNLVNGPD